MGLEKLVNVDCANFSDVHVDSIQKAFEIVRNSRTDKSLISVEFWTGDIPLYDVEQDGAILYLNGAINLIFTHFEDVTHQLRTNGNYVLPDQELVVSLKSGNALRTKLSDLNLQEEFIDYGYFDIDTSDYKTLNESQRAFAEYIYRDLKTSMKLLQKFGIGKQRIISLYPTYVKDTVKEIGPFSRACSLELSNQSHSFNAAAYQIVFSFAKIRGVPVEFYKK